MPFIQTNLICKFWAEGRVLGWGGAWNSLALQPRSSWVPPGPWVSFRSHPHVLLWAFPSLSSLPRSRWGPAARGTLPLRNLRGLQLHGPVPGVQGRLFLPSESGLDQELCQRHQGIRGRSVSRTHLASAHGSLPARVGWTPSRGAGCPLP